MHAYIHTYRAPGLFNREGCLLAELVIEYYLLGVMMEEKQHSSVGEIC